MKKREIVLAISDLHAPYHHPDALEFLKYLKKEFKPTKIICLGDEIDAHSLSVHPKVPELYAAGHEFEAAIEFLGLLYKEFPEVHACHSNHTSRVNRVAQAAGLPSRFIKAYHDILQAPKGWEWRDRWEIDDVIYEHGEMCGSGIGAAFKAAMQNRKSTVIGHLHSFGSVVYSANHDNQIFAANAGCLIDPVSLAFAYGNRYRNKCTLGSVVVDSGVNAHFVRLNK